MVGRAKARAAALLLLGISSGWAQAFQVEGWASGVRLTEVMNESYKAKLPIVPKGVRARKSEFDYEVATKGWGSHTAYTYQGDVEGEPATVTLSFTPTSFVLYGVEIVWDVRGPQKTDKARAEEALGTRVVRGLKGRYGEPKQGGGGGLMASLGAAMSTSKGGRFEGIAADGTKDRVEFVYGGGLLGGKPRLVYINEHLEAVSKREVTAPVKK